MSEKIEPVAKHAWTSMGMLPSEVGTWVSASDHATTVSALEGRIRELEAMLAAGIEGEVVEMGDDEDGNPRVTLHTTRDQIKREARNLMFKQARLIPVTGATQP